ncbi:MAG TPA: DMT family transporter [Candidatus Nanopelagicaceae bacterium]
MRERDHTRIPFGRDLGLLSLVVIGIGTSGPVIALSAMPILTLIFWRNLGGFLLVAPWVKWRQLFADPKIWRSVAMASLAGLALALHFFGFFLAMRLTSVAAGTALAALQPIFAAYFVRILGGRITRRVWLGMIVAFIGVLVITGVDFQLSTEAFLGDLAAIGCAALAAIYTIIGAQTRETLSTATYTSIVYLTCVIFSLSISLIAGVQLWGFPSKEWLFLIALIVGAQIMGHTIMNFTLKRVSPVIVSTVVFFEVPVSAILAFWWIGQLPPLGTIPGLILILVGCAIFTLRQNEKS